MLRTESFGTVTNAMRFVSFFNVALVISFINVSELEVSFSKCFALVVSFFNVIELVVSFLRYCMCYIVL